MTPLHFRARVRIQRCVDGPVLSVAIFKRLDGSNRFLPASSFIVAVQCLPTLVPHLAYMLTVAQHDGLLNYDDDIDGRPNAQGGDHE